MRDFSGLPHFHYNPITGLLMQKLVVFGMASNPEPKQPFFCFDGKRAIVNANSDCPIFANFLEVERWVRQISPEQSIACIG